MAFISKIMLPGMTEAYDIKDAGARELISQLAGGVDGLGTAASKDYNTSVIEGDTLPTGSAVIAYVTALIDAVKQFKYEVVTNLDLETAPTADQMYTIYLVADKTDNGQDIYNEYIVIEKDGVYSWEKLGDTSLGLEGYVPTTRTIAGLALNADIGVEALKGALAINNLGALAYKDNATGTVASETISGIKATGNISGSIGVTLTPGTDTVSSNGKFTPAGNVTGTAKDIETIAVTVSTQADDATLSTADYTPAGTIAVEVSGASFNAVKSAGTAASFQEGAFTAATLDREDVTANYATEGLVGTVADETLTFTAASTAAITATKVNNFTGGSKIADTFVANTPVEIEAHTVGATATFTGTKAEAALVTGVSYQKAVAEAGVNITKKDTAITATFAGTEGDLTVSGSYNTVTGATGTFTGDAAELNVDDIVVSEKTVTVQ